MKKITVPNSVQIVVLNQETNSEEVRDFSFSDFLINNALVHPAFGASIDTLEQSEQLEQKLSALQAGDEFEIDDNLWSLLNNVVNYPKAPYDVKLARKLLPFMRAIHNAK